MKKIIAIIRNECVEQSRAALAKLGVAGVAVLRVRENDRREILPGMPEPGFSTRHEDLPCIPPRTEEVAVEEPVPAPGKPACRQAFLLRGMLIMVVADDRVLPVVHALIAVNQRGDRSDGEIFICPMVTSLEIGNTERRNSAMP